MDPVVDAVDVLLELSWAGHHIVEPQFVLRAEGGDDAAYPADRLVHDHLMLGPEGVDIVGAGGYQGIWGSESGGADLAKLVGLGTVGGSRGRAVEDHCGG